METILEMLIAKETVSVMNDTIIRQIFSAANFWLWDKYFFERLFKEKKQLQNTIPQNISKSNQIKIFAPQKLT